MSNVYTPDTWKVIKIDSKEFPLTYKVFACWYGGYLSSNSWKLNSGITEVTKDGEFYLFEGHSGSVYKCHEKAYGTHMYGSGILNDIINKSEEIGVRVEILSENTNWLDLSYNIE
jgi:hypothetical protein